MTTSVFPAVPAEVAAFAAQAGVSESLPAVLELTRRVFLDLPLTLHIEDDPDISDRYLVLTVDVSSFSPESLFDRQQAWSRGLFEQCPAAQVHAFHLRMV